MLTAKTWELGNIKKKLVTPKKHKLSDDHTHKSLQLLTVFGIEIKGKQ